MLGDTDADALGEAGGVALLLGVGVVGAVGVLERLAELLTVPL